MKEWCNHLLHGNHRYCNLCGQTQQTVFHQSCLQSVQVHAGMKARDQLSLGTCARTMLLHAGCVERHFPRRDRSSCMPVADAAVQDVKDKALPEPASQRGAPEDLQVLLGRFVQANVV